MAGKKAGRGGWLLFWLAFFIGITLLFMLNLERIKATLEGTGVADRLFRPAETENPEEPEEPGRLPGRPEEPGGAPAASSPVEPELDRRIQELAEDASRDGNAAAARRTGQSTAGADESSGGGPSGTGPQVSAGRETPPAAPPSVPAGKIVERPIYLMKVDTTGAILWTRVKRDLPASDSPLQDVLESLIKGPSAAEEKQGLISLIPAASRILYATVRGGTAYVSFSEDFLFNTYGVEGYAGQRRQIVLTATEFSNVNDVQILIDGKRIDYLGEGVWIGSPVGRNML
jgi:spore germination protein GerM